MAFDTVWVGLLLFISMVQIPFDPAFIIFFHIFLLF